MGKTEAKPQIRFKGFSEAWEHPILGDIGKTYTGLSGKTREDFGHGEGAFVPYMNVFSNPITQVNKLEPIELDDKQNQVAVGDVFFTTSSETPEEVGMSSVLADRVENTYLNSFCFGYRPSIKFDNNYLAYMLRSNIVRKQITFLAQGISRYNISKNKVMEISIPKPQYAEQQKIGSFFSNIEHLLIQYQQELEKINIFKKTMLEKMFPKKGSDTPELRFKGYSDKWTLCKLGKVAPLRGGFAFQSHKFQKQGIPIVKIANILPNGEIGGEFDFYPEQPDDDCYALPEGAILLAMSGATTGKVAILHKKNKKIYQNQRVGYFTKNDSTDYSFIATITRSDKFTQQLKSVLIAGAQPNVSSKDIDNFEFYFPPQVSEQLKIGKFFSQIDDYTTQLQHKLEKLENLKKACLEKMFA